MTFYETNKTNTECSIKAPTPLKSKLAITIVFEEALKIKIKLRLEFKEWQIFVLEKQFMVDI